MKAVLTAVSIVVGIIISVFASSDPFIGPVSVKVFGVLILILAVVYGIWALTWLPVLKHESQEAKHVEAVVLRDAAYAEMVLSKDGKIALLTTELDAIKRAPNIRVEFTHLTSGDCIVVRVITGKQGVNIESLKLVLVKKEGTTEALDAEDVVPELKRYTDGKEPRTNPILGCSQIRHSMQSESSFSVRFTRSENTFKNFGLLEYYAVLTLQTGVKIESERRKIG